MKNLNRLFRFQFDLKFVGILFLNFGLFSIVNAQSLPDPISSVEENVFTERSETLIKGYFDNLTTIGKLDEEKDIFIGEFVNSTFENNQVRVYNDIDLTGSTQTDFDITTYLDNISLFFSNSDVDFEIQRMKLSKIFYSAEFLFIKAEVVRKMTIMLNQQIKIDSSLIDIYVKFIPFKSNPRIYSIKMHENNLDKFKLIKVTPATANETINNDVVMFTIPNLKPGQFYLTTAPEGAQVEFLDYPDFGKKPTPATLTYPATKYNIRITKDEYETLDTVINVGTDKSRLFSLKPTFSILNFNISPDKADLKVNGESKYFTNSIKSDLKIPKGKTTIEISAEHYYPKRIELDAVAGKTHNVNEMLKPKTGMLSLAAENADAIDAIVFIDNLKVGTLPLSKNIILEGKHTIRIEKSKLSTIIKLVDIKENTESKINISLFAAVKTAIKTEPSGATIFVDNKRIGTSNLSTKLPVGSHSIRMEKDYFETKTENIIIHENDQTGIFTFSLVPIKYSIYLNSKPAEADITLDGKMVNGRSPLQIETFKGLHTFRIVKEHYFPRTFIHNVSASGTSTVKKVLYPKRLFNLNGLYGLESWGLSLGGTLSHFSFSIDYFPSIENTVYSTNISNQSSGFNYDPNYMTTSDQKISVIDSAGFGWAVKGGFVILKPLMMRIHAGYGSRSFMYNDVFEVTEDATYSGMGGSGTIYKGELIKGSEQKTELFNSFIIGIEIPIRYLNFRVDYWFNSERGKGIVFGLGFNLF